MAEVFSKGVFFVSISSNIKTVITLLLITGRNTALQGVFEKYRGRNGDEDEIDPREIARLEAFWKQKR